MRSRGEIEHDDAGRVVRRAGAKYGAATGSPHETELCEWCLERSQQLVFQVKHCKLAEPACGIGADDPIWSSARISRCTETPQRHSELGRHWRKRFSCPRGKIKAVEVPPIAAIGHEEDCPTISRPFGLKDRLRHAAGFARGSYFGASRIRAFATACQVARSPVRIRPIRSAPESFYFQASNGSVALPVAGYDYNSDWTPLLTGLSPARMAASLAAPDP